MMHMCSPNPMPYSGASFPGPAKPSSGGGSAPVVTMDDMNEEFLQKYHTGEANSISSRQLEHIYGISGSTVREVVNRLRAHGVPICSYAFGYYYAETKEELDRTIRQLRSRISKIAEAERGLVKACQMPQYGGGAPHNGQLNMFAQ